MNARLRIRAATALRRLSAALVGVALAGGVAHANQRRYMLDAAPAVTIRSADSVSFQQFAPTSDGRFFALGTFNYVNGIEHPWLARLQSNGQLDPSFVAAVNGIFPLRFAVTPTGAVWCTGAFGTPPTLFQVVRLNPDGTRDESIAPINLNSNFVRDLIVLPDGGIYVIDSVSGSTRVQRFTSTGTPEPSFATVNYPSFASTWAVSSTGEIALVGFGAGPSTVAVFDANGVAEPTASAAIPSNFGVFGAVYDDTGALILSGQTFGPQNPVLLRILADRTLDPSFSGVAPYSQASGSNVIRLADGTLVLLGSANFASAILEFSPTGNFERSLPILGPGGATPIMLGLQSLGSDYLLSGHFESVNGTASPQVARIDAAGTVEAGFHAQFLASGQVNAVVRSASGSTLVGGDFTDVGGQAAGGVAALTNNGTLDTAFPAIAFGANALVPTTDGGVVVFGAFPAFPGTTTNGLVKLRADRTADPAFLAGNFLFGFQTGLGLSDGSVLLGGSFGSFPGQSWPASFLTRVLPDGSIDSAFNNHTTLAGDVQIVSALATDANGRILVAGAFTEFQGAARSALARTDSNGNVDSTFVPPVGLSPNGLPGDLRVLGDGRFYVRGVAGDNAFQGAPTLLRFNPDGTIDSTFAPNFGSGVSSYAVASDGTVYVTTYGLPARLFRVCASGEIDPGFSFEFNQSANAVAIDPDGAILVGGRFTTVNGVRREALARLIPVPLSVAIDGPAARDVRLLATLTLTATVEGAADQVAYQWYHDGRPINGATAATLTLTHIVPKDGGAYTVVVKSGNDSAASAAVNVKVTPGVPAGVTPQGG